MAVLLAIDTSDRLAHVAAAESSDFSDSSEEVRIVSNWTSEKKSVEQLPRLVFTCLEELNVGYQDLHAVVVAIGPGSFTGIRGGVAFAQGLSFSLGIPVIGISCLLSRSHVVLPKGNAAVCLRASNTDFYLADVTREERTTFPNGDIRIVDSQEIEHLCAVNLQDMFDLESSPDSSSPLATALVRYYLDSIHGQLQRSLTLGLGQIQYSPTGGEISAVYGKGVAAKTLEERHNESNARLNKD